MRVSMTILLTCVLHLCYPVHCQNKQLSLSISLLIQLIRCKKSAILYFVCLSLKTLNSTVCRIKTTSESENAVARYCIKSHTGRTTAHSLNKCEIFSRCMLHKGHINDLRMRRLYNRSFVGRMLWATRQASSRKLPSTKLL